MSMFNSKKPYSAITVAIERLTHEQFEDDDFSGIPGLVESISLQSTGPSEAARAIRKKLKYGNVHRQIRALTILDGLIQNAGPHFQRNFVDEMLLERLRVCGTSDLSDPMVKEKCKVIFRSWAAEYKNIRGLEEISALYKQLPRRKQAITKDKSQVLRETEQNPFEPDEDEINSSPCTPTYTRKLSLPGSRGHSTHNSTTSSFFSNKKLKREKGKKQKEKPFNIDAEKTAMKSDIAEASVASTNLLNSLKLINREREQISENQAAVDQFDFCKLLRRKILRYIQHVESEAWLGALLHANDDLVTALMTFEQLDRSIDADSDSENELAQQHVYQIMTENSKAVDTANQLARLHIDREISRPPPVPPPRPSNKKSVDHKKSEECGEEDEDDPFADRNAVITPKTEKSEPVW